MKLAARRTIGDTWHFTLDRQEGATTVWIGLWDTAPYLHDGRAATIEDVLHSAEHGGTDMLTQGERTPHKKAAPKDHSCAGRSPHITVHQTDKE